ncbi:MAG: undecaprenyldiphospho-muramoylpentapeptide beta-N-acetylglucosaminyltransferase [Chloroflexota bacterium]|nr:undecaprenyldiphospho-muramoylpentapeptide beta-N-acetylglucosaminyltransferase [Chloroflexota bacterium]
MRLVIAGGGTGGHVGPALATIEALRARRPDGGLHLLWIGTDDGVECRAATERGIPFRAIQAGKLRRYFSLRNAIDAARIPVGVAQALAALRRFRPDVVFSTGGFVSVPTVVAAAALRRPVLIHEQTAQFGLANRINLRFATTVALPYEASRAFLPPTGRRVVVTGNPVRADLLTGDAAEGARLLGLDPARPTLYVTGGARGAHKINRTVAALLPGLLERAQVIHSCGPREANGDFADLTTRAAGWPVDLRSRYAVREFIGAELPHVYALAALVVGRAGAGTVAELAALGKPAILIPLPGTGGDEQTKNARLLADAGGAVLLPEHELAPDHLAATIDRLLAAPGELARMGQAARTQAPTGAAERLADELLRLDPAR